MGSIAQEMGHDLTIMYFIDKVLKPREKKEDFFTIHPAIGPKRDVYYWNPKENEYTSAWDVSKQRFVPEFLYRKTFDKAVMEKLTAESQYWNEPYYNLLTEKLGEDLKKFTDKLCSSIEELIEDDFPTVDKLPDFIGVKERKIASFGEIKFEYLPRKALNEFLAFDRVARYFKVPFYLVFPKKGFYSSTDYAWLRKNLQKDIEFYTFEGPKQEGKKPIKPIVLPNYYTIIFKRWIQK